MRETRPVGTVRRVPQREAVMFVVILALAAALRLWGLGTKSFWVDEILAIERSRSLRQAVMDCALGHEPPLRYVILHHLARLNPPELFARLPSFLFGVATVGLLWLLARTLFGARVAIVAAFLLAVSPWHIIHSQDARMYAVMMFFWVLSLLLFFGALERPTQPLWWPALAIVHAVNFYLSYLTVFVLAAEVLTLVGWVVVRKWRAGATIGLSPKGAPALGKMPVPPGGRFALKPYAVGALIFAGFFSVCISFWLYPLGALVQRYLDIGTPETELLIRAVYESGQIDWPAAFDAQFFVNVLDRLLATGHAWRVVALVGLSAGLSLCWRRNRPFVWIAALSFFITMAVILFTEMKHFVAPRYVFHFLLFFVIVLAVAIVAAAEAIMARAATRVRGTIAGIVLALATVVAMEFYVPGVLLHVRAERQDWRTACRFLAENAEPDDVVITGPWGTHLAVSYYGGSALAESHAIINCLTIERTVDEIERAADTAGVWYISWGYLPPELRLIVEEELDREVSLPGLRGTIEIFRRRR